MKVKHIITACGIILGGLVISAVMMTSGANATLNYTGKSDVQFTFRPMLTLALSNTASACPAPYVSPTFCIENLAPGNNAVSNEVTANVVTNSAAGYKLSATVGDGVTYTNSNLVGASDNFTITSGNVASLASGTWGIRVDDNGTYGNYKALDTTDGTILNMTSNNTGTAVTNYPGTNTTKMQIGANAKTSQVAGAYQNVINFTALANVINHTVTLNTSTNVASALITAVDGSALTTPVASGSYGEGQVLTIAATCDTGYQFNGWNRNYDYGVFANKGLATTTYTVGGGSVALTAYCVLPTT